MMPVFDSRLLLNFSHSSAFSIFRLHLASNQKGPSFSDGGETYLRSGDDESKTSIGSSTARAQRGKK
jgi:hypothetical protein